MFRFSVGVCALACAVATVAAGAATPSVRLALAGAVVSRDASGAERLTPLADHAAIPGETIRYTISAENAGSDAARTLVPSGRIPAGTQLRSGSLAASGPATVEFSLDGGKTWSAKPMVAARTPQGVTLVPAPLSAYTAIRWNAGRLGPHERERFSYEVTVR